MSKVHDTPSAVQAEAGEVQIDGPDGVAVALTPEAALETSDRLLSGATEAQGQRVQQDRIKHERAERHLSQRTDTSRS